MQIGQGGHSIVPGKTGFDRLDGNGIVRHHRAADVGQAQAISMGGRLAFEIAGEQIRQRRLSSWDMGIGHVRAPWSGVYGAYSPGSRRMNASPAKTCAR